MGVILTLVGIRTRTFSFWSDEAFLRRFRETLVFLHHQAVADQAFYQLRLDFEKQTYRVVVARGDSDIAADLQAVAGDAGTITLELAAFLNPSIGKNYTLIAPPSFPSMAEPVPFPLEMQIRDIRTAAGIHRVSDGGTGSVTFSPRGFSDFAVMHLSNQRGGTVTVLVNPFTGDATLYRDDRDFEWSYGRKKEKN